MTVSPVPGVLITAFQSNAFQANAFQIGGSGFIFQPGTKGTKHEDYWFHDDDFEKEARNEAIAIMLLLD